MKISKHINYKHKNIYTHMCVCVCIYIYERERKDSVMNTHALFSYIKNKNKT